MKLNDEVALVIRDEQVAMELEKTFLEDLEYADEIELNRIRLHGGAAIKSRLARFATPLL